MRRHMFQADRYHMTQGNFSLTPHSKLADNLLLAEAPARFYASFRKLPFAPCVGHDLLVEFLSHTGLDSPRIEYLKNDRADLSLVGKYLEHHQIGDTVRAVNPGTIMFPREPIADIFGPFILAQLAEIKFEHAFDVPMTVASRALEMRLTVGWERMMSDFSNRRDGSVDRSVDVAKYSYIGGFNDTSNMEAGHLLNEPTSGTMAHFNVKSFIGVKENDSKTSLSKHFQQVCFERWLDAHPKGTTLLIDTIDVPLGIKHAIAAAKSSPERTGAFKSVRIDSNPLGRWSKYIRKCLDLNGFSETKIVATGDLDKDSLAKLIEECPEVYGFGIGTKVISEVENVAGIVFKESEINGKSTIKCSSKEKSTLPGKLQVWRFSDGEGFYCFDVIATAHLNRHHLMAEFGKQAEGVKQCAPLLRPFWIKGAYQDLPSKEEQKLFVQAQALKFRDLYHYPVYLSAELTKLRDETMEFMNSDLNEYPDIVMPDLEK